MLKVKSVDKNSIAEEFEIKPGDCLVKIDGKEVEDILDYLFLEGEDRFLLEFKRGEDVFECEVERDLDEEMGLNFEDNLEIKQCHNNCKFCFVKQMPKGLRESLYVKDDDYRLSFISGSYITMTNLSDADMERIIRMRLSPIYVSVHSTTPENRADLLCNRFAGDVLDKLTKLCQNGIEVHTQVVLCKGINDGKILEKTLQDLHALYPACKSLAIVPVGLTKYRDGLPNLSPFDEQSANEIIDLVESYSNGFLKVYGEPFVYLSDEFYCITKREFPKYEHYGEFDQIENGVGMVRKLIDEFNEAKTVAKKFSKKKTALITGKMFYPYLVDMLKSVGCNHTVLGVENEFFGSTVSVAGLLTGQDIIKNVKKGEYQRIILPINVLKEFGDVFLDGITLKEFSKEVKANVVVCKNDGFELYNLL